MNVGESADSDAAGRGRTGVRLFVRGAVASAVIAVGSIMAIGVTSIPAAAGGTLHLKPKTVKFPAGTVAGGPCEGSGCSYADVSVVNDTSLAETVTGGSTGSTVFWITWGGTCNVDDAYVVPAHSLCTVQFGFEPTTANTTYVSTGTLDFYNDAQLSVKLKGRSAS